MAKQIIFRTSVLLVLLWAIVSYMNVLGACHTIFHGGGMITSQAQRGSVKMAMGTPANEKKKNILNNFLWS